MLAAGLVVVSVEGFLGIGGAGLRVVEVEVEERESSEGDLLESCRGSTGKVEDRVGVVMLAPMPLAAFLVGRGGVSFAPSVRGGSAGAVEVEAEVEVEEPGG